MSDGFRLLEGRCILLLCVQLGCLFRENIVARVYFDGFVTASVDRSLDEWRLSSAFQEESGTEYICSVLGFLFAPGVGEAAWKITRGRILANSGLMSYSLVRSPA